MADDGREFKTEAECAAYEKHCAEAAETELRLLTQVLASRVSNLPEDSASLCDGIFPPELLESFDHCEFSDKFLEFASRNMLTPRLLVEQLNAYALLGMLAQKMHSVFGERYAWQQIAGDLAPLSNLGFCDIVEHLDSLSRLGRILSNLDSEKDEIVGYYWDHVDRLHRAQEDYLEGLKADEQMECPSGDEHDSSCEWQEELANRDPFEGSPF